MQSDGVECVGVDCGTVEGAGVEVGVEAGFGEEDVRAKGV